MKVRFAPSPTGYLHVGNARTAVVNALFAARHGADLLLRLDDTDQERSRPEYAASIEQDLRWLGVHWTAMVRQSDRTALYAAAAEQLKSSGRLYPCFESEEELAAKRDQRVKRHQPPVYDRAMLKLTPEQRARAEAGGKRPYWRFRLSDTTVTWPDLVLGRREVKLPSVSDPVLLRADGSPLYSFTSIVDDLDTGITHVIRGEDHITNTGVQIDIAAALGRPAPHFAHLPLLIDSEGGKLSKRIGSATLRGMRADGVEPVALVAYLARLGTSDDPAPLPLAELATNFDLGRFARSSAKFDGAQLLTLNRRVLQSLPFDAVRDRLPPGATEGFWTAVRGNLDLLGEARAWWDVVAGTIVAPDQPEEGPFLSQALGLLPPDPWSAEAWTLWTSALKVASGRRGRALVRPLRLALTGEEHGPELRELLPLMGRGLVAARLREGAVSG